jgi:hypothetical protein
MRACMHGVSGTVAWTSMFGSVSDTVTVASMKAKLLGLVHALESAACAGGGCAGVYSTGSKYSQESVTES